MKGLRSIRPLGHDSLRGVDPATVSQKLPKFEMVDPKTLYVEESYQREIRGNGTALIRKIYAGFSWARYKPPVCVRLPESGSVLVCIDGQHTATAAATHPAIEKIPVMVIDAADASLRAAAFVGHNRDRLGLTPPAIYRADLVGGDPHAVAIDRACRAAGATVLDKSVNLREKQPVGSTIAIGTMKAVLKRRGEEALARVMRVLVRVGRGPIKADEIGAVALILAGAGEAPGIDERLRQVIASKTTEAWAALGMVDAAHTGEALSSAVATAWCLELDIRLDHPRTKAQSQKGNATSAARSLPQAAPSDAHQLPSRDKPNPRPPPEGVLPKPTQATPQNPQKGVLPVSTPSSPTSPSGGEVGVVRHNGVTIDLRTRQVTHRGQTVKINREDGIQLVRALAHVMPAILDPMRLATKAFGTPGFNPAERLRDLIVAIAPELRRARLEIKTVPKMGNSLFDLGPGE